MFQKATIFLSIAMMGWMVYQFNYVNQAKPWTHFQKPQAAAYTNLEQDEAILKELDHQTTFSSYKALDPVFFNKPTIFDLTP